MDPDYTKLVKKKNKGKLPKELDCSLDTRFVYNVFSRSRSVNGTGNWSRERFGEQFEEFLGNGSGLVSFGFRYAGAPALKLTCILVKRSYRSLGW